MTHLTPEQRSEVTDDMLAAAIQAHARRAGLTVAQWLDREIARDLWDYLATEGIEVEETE